METRTIVNGNGLLNKLMRPSIPISFTNSIVMINDKRLTFRSKVSYPEPMHSWFYPVYPHMHAHPCPLMPNHAHSCSLLSTHTHPCPLIPTPVWAGYGPHLSPHWCYLIPFTADAQLMLSAPVTADADEGCYLMPLSRGPRIDPRSTRSEVRTDHRSRCSNQMIKRSGIMTCTNISKDDCD